MSNTFQGNDKVCITSFRFLITSFRFLNLYIVLLLFLLFFLFQFDDCNMNMLHCIIVAVL